MIKNTKVASALSTTVGKLLAFVPLHPNSITILSVIMAVFGYLSYAPAPASAILSFLFFILAFFFDAVDGAVARARNIATKEGGFLDGIADRVVEFMFIFTLFGIFLFNQEFQNLLLVILFFGTGMTSFVKAYAQHQGMLTHEQASRLGGILERPERIILLLAVFILTISSMFFYAKIALYITAGLSIITFLQRFLLVLYAKDSSSLK